MNICKTKMHNRFEIYQRGKLTQKNIPRYRSNAHEAGVNS
jgi:hypothetical protein